MVSSKRWGIIIFTLSILFLFSSACSLYEPISTQLGEPHDEPTNPISFQEYLWKEHPLDLIIQTGLLLAGAFGVAALLPSPEEEEPK